jgi:hypothetical protein
VSGSKCLDPQPRPQNAQREVAQPGRPAAGEQHREKPDNQHDPLCYRQQRQHDELSDRQDEPESDRHPIPSLELRDD